jgi:hypothetical protein
MRITRPAIEMLPIRLNVPAGVVMTTTTTGWSTSSISTAI